MSPKNFYVSKILKEKISVIFFRTPFASPQYSFRAPKVSPNKIKLKQAIESINKIDLGLLLLGSHLSLRERVL